MKKCLQHILSVAAASFLTATAVSAASLNVGADANIFEAGHSTVSVPPGGGEGGTVPPGYSFSAAANQLLTISSITGSVNLTESISDASHTGNGTTHFSGGTHINSLYGISGINVPARTGFLVGVFLTDAEPTNPVPASLTFTANENFTTLSPLIGQIFLIGDGKNDVNQAVQSFVAPNNATRLFLGFADADSYSGDPGQYQDNLGSLAVSFQIAAVPEPAAYFLALAGLGILGGMARRNRIW